jgi:hypothetical protein
MTYVLEKGGGWLYEAVSPRHAANALLAAVEDRAVLAQKKSEARNIAHSLFSTEAVNEQLGKLEAEMKRLSFNGRITSVEKARKMRSVTLPVALKRRLLEALGLLKWNG